jgi:hypothetical protein
MANKSPRQIPKKAHGKRLTYMANKSPRQYMEVAHIAHEDIRQRAIAFGVATPVVAPND